MYVNFCLNLTISFGVMSVTESSTGKNKSDLRNYQSIQIGNTRGQVLKICCFYQFFGQVFMILVQLDDPVHV